MPRGMTTSYQCCCRSCRHIRLRNNQQYYWHRWEGIWWKSCLRRVVGVVGVDVGASDVIVIQEQTSVTIVADDDGFDIDIICAVVGTELA